jgi:hypothetical protein
MDSVGILLYSVAACRVLRCSSFKFFHGVWANELMVWAPRCQCIQKRRDCGPVSKYRALASTRSTKQGVGGLGDPYLDNWPDSVKAHASQWNISSQEKNEKGIHTVATHLRQSIVIKEYNHKKGLENGLRRCSAAAKSTCSFWSDYKHSSPTPLFCSTTRQTPYILHSGSFEVAESFIFFELYSQATAFRGYSTM